MKSIVFTLTQCGIVAALLGLLGPVPGVVAPAHAWYGCPDNSYNLELRNNNTQARCYRARSRGNRVQPDAGCPVGTTFNQDNRGNVDYCLPIGGTVVGRAIAAACKPNEEVVRQTGRDRCYAIIPADEKPVSTNR